MYIGVLARGGGGAAVVHQGQHQREAAERQRYMHMHVFECIHTTHVCIYIRLYMYTSADHMSYVNTCILT